MIKNAALDWILNAICWPYRRWHHWRYCRASFNYFYFRGLMASLTVDDPALYKARLHLLLAEQAVEYHGERAGLQV